jgi:hypothetical protein
VLWNLPHALQKHVGRLCRDKAACYADGNETTDVIDETDAEWNGGEGVQTVALPA